MAPLIELREVSKSFGANRVFAGVSLSVPPFENVALVGPSGCGKSTLLRLIAGLEAPDAGEVWINGSLVSRAGQIRVPPHQRQLAMVFQDLALWPNLSPLDNVVLGLSGTAVTMRDRKRRSIESLELCGIADLARRKLSSLSGGQLQRVALARALALQPNLLLFDEPFVALDLIVKASLYAQIRRLSEEERITLVMVTHDPMEATALCTHGAVLERGTIQERGEFSSLLKDPISETLRAFVKQLPPRSGTD